MTVKIPNPKVIHERMVSDIPPTGVPLVHLIDSAISLSKDETHSESARNAIDVMDLKNILGNHFVENIRHANLFNEIVYFPNQPDDNRKQFFREKYYAVLEIDIRDLSFVRTGDGNLCLYIDIRGTMIKQDDKEILWSRQETIRSKETYTLAFVTTYSDELRKVFYQTFQSLAERLAADFLYLE
ncbi:MAG TPA: hypothetical protein VMT12_03275 [Syntrophales bacterium]|nr:hypothetical protein [Syntrophales bacterium]